MMVETGHTAIEEYDPLFPNRLEQEDRGVVGFIEPYLRYIFLAPYLADIKEQYPESNHAETLPLAIESIVYTLLETPNLEQMVLFGSIARYMAKGMSERHWQMMHNIDDVKRRWSSDELVREFFNHPLGFSKDPDMDLTVQGVSVEQLSEHLKTALDIQESEIETETFQHLGMNYTREQYKRSYGAYTVSVSVGPIQTVPDIHNMVIGVYDTKNGERLFHFDISEPPQTGSAVEREKRVGKTSRWQDECVAELTLNNDRVQYYISPEAREVLFQQDYFLTETHNPDDMTEMFLRAVRMHALHGLESIPLVENQVYLKLPQLAMLYPYFSSVFEPRIGREKYGLFHVRHQLIDFILHGKQIENTGVTYLNTKELFLNLMINPYLTIQAIRDSGMYLFIPRLATITRKQWDQILCSRHFVVQALKTDQSGRTLDFMNEEQLAYVRTGQHDGIERFIRALDELHIIQATKNPYLDYLELWNAADEAHTFTMPLTLFPQFEESSTLHSLDLIRQHAPGTHLGIQISSYDSNQNKPSRPKTEVEQHALTMIRNHMLSLGTMYEILGLFPCGLTAREMLLIYNQVNMKRVIKTPDFGEVLLDLKLLSMLNRYGLQRVHVAGHTEEVVFYTTRANGASTKLLNLASSTRFQQFVDETYKNTVQLMNIRVSDLIFDIFQTVMNEYGIVTVEALKTLSKKDVERLLRRAAPGQLVASVDHVYNQIAFLLSLYENFQNKQ